MTKQENSAHEIKYYKVIRDENATTLRYKRSSEPAATDAAKLTAALKLRQRCDNALFRVDKLQIDQADKNKLDYEERQRGYFDEIELFAREGLEQGDLVGANSNVDSFEKRFVEFEGPDVRQRFLKKTLLYAASLGIVFLLMGLSIESVSELSAWFTGKVSGYFGWQWQLGFPKYALEALLFIFVGNGLGVVLSAFTRNLKMTFQNLGNFDAAGLKPVLRFVFVGVLSVVVATFLQQELIKVCFGGSYCLDQSFFTPAVDPMKCIVIGIVCGLADVLITRVLTETVDKAADKQGTA